MAIRPESCRLYDLNVVELLRDTEEYMGVLESLGMIGVTEEHLERMATNPRHQLFLLLGPTDTWDEHGPTVYCAIQACLEGEINDMPDLDENDPKFKREIRKSFQMFPQLPNNLLVGVRVVQVFLPPNLQEEEAYESTALMLLRRYFNGEAAQHVIQEVPQREQNILTRLHAKQGQIHYIGTFANPLMDDVRRWERNGLELFFVGYIQEDEVTCIMLSKLDDYETFINRVYNHCSPDDLFKGFGQMFISLLCYWRDCDRVLALRILRDNMALVREGDQGVVEKPWANNIVKIAEQRMEAFIGNHGSIELVADLVPGIAQSYFGGKLRINLAENEEYVLLLMGLNGCVFDRVKEAMNHLEEAELLSCLRRIFITAVDYFNIPEVVDDDN